MHHAVLKYQITHLYTSKHVRSDTQTRQLYYALYVFGSISRWLLELIFLVILKVENILHVILLIS